MLIGAEIKAFPAHCEDRHRLSTQVRTAIQTVYARTEELERAKRTGEGLVQAVNMLRAAREECLNAERVHDAHVREHGCLSHPKALATMA